MNSILVRLLVWQIGTLIITAAFITALTYQLTWSEFNRNRDISLEQVAWAVMRHQGMHPEIYSLTDKHDRIISQVWDDKGQLLFASRPDDPAPRQMAGVSTFTWHDKQWHAVVIEDRGTIVQIANSSDERAVWFREFGTSLIIPFLVLVILMGGFIAVAATQAFQPLRQLRREILQRNPDYLSPLPREQYPGELLVIVDALNDMFCRLDRAFLARQRFIADAAHELRTPLTGVQLNAEIVQNEADGTTRQEALTNLRRGVERAAHLVNQLLQFARFDPQFIARRPMTTVDMADVAKTVIVELDILAARKDIDLGLNSQAPAKLVGDPEGLRILLSNLVDNAIRYTGNGGRIDIDLAATGERVALAIIDNGPGIAADDRQRMFEAFFRGSSDAPGSGLGLAIALEIVHQHQGRIALEDTPGGGLTVRISLPCDLRKAGETP